MSDAGDSLLLVARNEAETRSDLIDPALEAAGWVDGLVDREYMYRPGRLRLLGETTVRDDPQYVDYVLRDTSRGFILATVEAKDEDHAPGAGLQQALAYATDVGAPFAFSSNGHGIVEQDLRTGAVRQLTEFPTRDDLLTRWRAGGTGNGPKVTNRRGETVDNPLLEPAFAQPGALPMRYYQERAVTAALSEMVAGRNRCLLTLATGTGKTFIAFTAAHKLTKAGWAKKVLFLADRVSLRDQAYNEWWAFGERRAVVLGDQSLPLHRDIHFAIYQGLWADAPGGGRLYEQYPRDYFDLIVIDECHRSGYGDWGAILDHFDGAFHLGLTATPKRSDSIDTYEFFGKEQPDKDGNPAAVFEYSLGRGLDDGYLATYKVHRVTTNLDEDGLNIHDELERGADLIVPDDVEPSEIYRMKQFERDIVVPDRTRVMCEHLAGILRKTGVNAKTMVFCVTMEHADLVRQEMQRLLGSETGKNLYAARIVSEERDSQGLLEAFQDSNSTEPVVVTTVDLLTTGVNAPDVRNIVFMKPIGSTTVFKQIIGRGTRLNPATGKTWFRIIDYTNATRLLDAWDTPPQPKTDQPTTGDEVITGHVVDAMTQDPVEASVTVRVGKRLIAEEKTDLDGEFAIKDMPLTSVDMYVTALGYARRALIVDTALREDVLVELNRPKDKSQRVRISGVDVNIGSEIEVDLGDGHELKPTEYSNRARDIITSTVTDAGDLHARWKDTTQRKALQATLTARQVTAELLEVVLGRVDVDEYDLLAHVGFGAEMVTREQRATAARLAVAHKYPDLDPAFLGALLDRYLLAGVNEVATAEVFSLPPFTTTWGGLGKVVEMMGSAGAVTSLLVDLSGALYAMEFDA